MNRYKLKSWWILTVKGMAALCFISIATWVPAYFLPVLFNFCGIILIVGGVLLIFSSVVQKIMNDRTWMFTEGFLDIVIGIIALSFHDLPAETFISTIGIWISFIGILQIANRYRLNSLFNHWGFLLFNGLLAIIFATVLFRIPDQSAITRNILIGLQSGVLTGFLAVSSCHVRKLLADIKIDIPHKEGDEGNQELTYF
jgi:uncharacterized membrane protein HdeD (DUF308 family)